MSTPEVEVGMDAVVVSGSSLCSSLEVGMDTMSSSWRFMMVFFCSYV